MTNIVFWDLAPCGSGLNRRFGGTYHLHLRRENLKSYMSKLVNMNEPISEDGNI
jgi:hypothetical protein